MEEKEKPASNEKEKKTKAPKEKESKKGLIIKIAAAVVVLGALVTAGIIFIPKLFKAKEELSLFFVEDDKLVFWNKNKKEKIIIDNEFDTNSLNVKFNSDKNLVVYKNDKTLYLYDIKEEKAEKITSSSSSYFYLTPDGKHLLYQDEDETLLSYSIKDKTKEKIATLSDNGAYILVFEAYDDKVIYSESIKDKEGNYNSVLYVNTLDGSNKIKISENVINKISKNENEIIFNAKLGEDEFGLYNYNIKKDEKTKILDSVADIIDYNDDFTKFIYKAKSKTPLETIDDDEKDKDLSVTTKKKQKCTYSAYWNDECSFDDYWYDRYYTKTTTTDKNKTVNDPIREKQKELQEKIYDVYIYEDGKTTLIDSNVGEIYASNIENNTIVYDKIVINEKIKMSELKSLNDYTNFVQDKYGYYYKTSNGEVQALQIQKLEADKVVGDTKVEDTTVKVSLYGAVISNDNYIYFKNSLDELYYINANKDNSISLIETKIEGLSNFNNKIFYSSNKKDDLFDLYLINNGTSKLIAEKAAMVGNENDVMYIYSDCSNYNSCDVNLFKNDKLEKITSDVYELYPISDNEYFVLKNYKKDNSLVDIYYLKGKKLDQIAFDIKTSLIKIN